MGCFDVVCALTNTPIHHGDKCHLITLRRDTSWDTMTWLMTSEGRLGFDRVFHGEYNDYGSIEECTPALDEGGADEAYLETLFDHDNPRKHFFVCETAWAWAQEKFKDLVPWFVRDRLMQKENYERMFPGKTYDMFVPEEQEEQVRIARLMQGFELSCKHPLSGLGLYRQYDRDVVNGIRENMALMEKRLQEIEERNKEWDEE